MNTCVYCGCSEAQACDGGCSWSNPEQTICTLCASAAETAAELVRVLGAVVDQAKVGMSLAFLVWEQLTLEQQKVMVLTCRAVVDTVRVGILEAIGEEAQIAVGELHLLTQFVLEKCPDQIRDEDALSDVVIRLLEPHVGSRITLPPGVRL